MAQQDVVIGDTGQQMVDKLKNNFDELYGKHVQDDDLIKWAAGKNYELTTRTLDSEGRTTSAVVEWPDGSAGTYTATDYNTTHEVYDGYTISHTASGKTVTQAAVTRNADGAITLKPLLTVA